MKFLGECVRRDAALWRAVGESSVGGEEQGADGRSQEGGREQCCQEEARLVTEKLGYTQRKAIKVSSEAEFKDQCV